MKTLFLLLLLIQKCSFSANYKEVVLKNEKKYNFGDYRVVTGNSDKGSAILIFKCDKSIYKSYRGDGTFATLDTMDINKDGRLDFIFSYSFDDYTNLGMVVSVDKKMKYEIKSIIDNLFKDEDCSVTPFQIDDESLKDFVLTDIDKDGNIDILTLAVQNPGGRVSKTDCSITILYQQLLQILNR